MGNAMTTIKLKRVYDQEEKSDGFRILVDRLWPRGMKKESLHDDLWAKELSPSSELRQWYHDDMEGRWKDFCRKYRSELEHSEAAKQLWATIRSHKTITLLYAAKDENQNHALVLKKFLDDLAADH